MSATAKPCYRLLMTPRSPFARRVRLALMRLNIPFERDEVNVFDPPAGFLRVNPLGQVPVLITPAGRELPDSWAILEYLNETHGGIWPRDPDLRFIERSASVLAEGVMTFTVAHYLEGQRPANERSPGCLQEYRENIERTLAHIQDQGLDVPPWTDAGHPTQAGWDLAVALQYLNLRIPALGWESKYPSLLKFFERVQGLPQFEQTAPPPA